MDHIDIARLQRLDAEHHLHPFNDNAALATRGTRILTRGEGAYVWDAEGNKLLHAFAGLWCVNLGYGRRELGEAARRQLKLAEKLRQVGNHEKAIEIARRSIEKDASAAAPHVLIGQILAGQGNRAEALKEFELALKLEPTNTNALAGAKALLEGSGEKAPGP